MGFKSCSRFIVGFVECSDFFTSVGFISVSRFSCALKAGFFDLNFTPEKLSVEIQTQKQWLSSKTVITCYAPSCFGQEKAKQPFGFQVNLSTTHNRGLTVHTVRFISDRQLWKLEYQFSVFTHSDHSTAMQTTNLFVSYFDFLKQCPISIINLNKIFLPYRTSKRSFINNFKFFTHFSQFGSQYRLILCCRYST